MNINVLMNMENNTSFDSNDLSKSLSISKSYANKIIQNLLKQNYIARIGRNRYQLLDNNKSYYNYEYSILAQNIANIIEIKYPYIDFSIFELVQLNYFINHLYGKNIIFISIENGMEEYVFDTLSNMYPGKVLISCTVEEFNRYAFDGSIVILKQISEAPKNKECKWKARIEKVIVDLFTEKLLLEVINSNEYKTIIEEVFKRYIIDEDCMFRYARRRNAQDKIIDYIKHETDIILRKDSK